MTLDEFAVKAEAAGYRVRIQGGAGTTRVSLDNGRQEATWEILDNYCAPLPMYGRLAIQSTMGLLFQVTVPLASLDEALVMLGVQEFVDNRLWDALEQWAKESKPRRGES